MTYDPNSSTFSEIVALSMDEDQQRVLRKQMIRAFGYTPDGTSPKVRKPTHPSIQRNTTALPGRQQGLNGNGFRSVTTHYRG